MSIKDKILARLVKGEISGEALALELGVTRTAVWKSVKALTREGFDVSAITNRGYKLNKPAPVCKAGVNHYLNTVWDVDVLEMAESTNDVAKQRAPVSGNLAVIAKSQTRGRGRLGREFVSPEGGLYLSAIVRPDLHVSESGRITAYSAVAVARAVESVCGLDVKIKWVNDLYVNGRKLCGILTEGSVGMEGGMLDYAVIGIGVNAHNVLPEPLKSIATSIEEESGKRVDINELSARILDNLSALPREIKRNDFVREYRKRSFLIGRAVTAGEYGEVVVIDIDDDCALIVERNGERIRLMTGEVSVRTV